MTALPDWMVLPPEGLSAADYEALPEDVRRQIEIVDGFIVTGPAPRPEHQEIIGDKLMVSSPFEVQLDFADIGL